MVRFTDLDGYILWCVSDQGCDLAHLIRAYMFFNRDAAPNYAELAGCLGRAIQAGAMLVPTDGQYRLAPGWLVQTPERDGRSVVPEDRMIEFAEWLASREWPVVHATGFVLAHGEYVAAVGDQPRHAEHCAAANRPRD